MIPVGITPPSPTVIQILWIVFLLNVGVSAVKLLFGYSIHSIALVADGYHSATDAAMNIVGLGAVYFAMRPPDANHPYGHKKFETIASLLVGVLLLVVAYEIVRMALVRWSADVAPNVSVLSMVSLLFTMGVNTAVSVYEARAGRRLGSDFLQADATQTRGDVGISASVLASLWATRAGFASIDLVVAGLVAVAIIYSGARIFRRSIAVLVDQIAIEEGALRVVIGSIAGIDEIRRVRTRGRPDHIFVDVDIAVAPSMTVDAAHEIADRVERRLKESDPRIGDIVIHVEPVDLGT